MGAVAFAVLRSGGSSGPDWRNRVNDPCLSILSVAAVGAALALAGCSSPDASAAGTGGGGGSGGGSGGSSLAPPPAGQGVQYEMQTTIAKGSEDERCKFVTAPEDLWVHQEDVRYTPGSHHFILWNTTYSSIPTMDQNGNTVDTSGVFECPGGPPAAWSVNRYVGGSQSAYAPNVLGTLPDNFAIHIPAGSVLMMDLHVLNTTTAALPVTVQMNLDTIPASQVTQEAGIYFFYNPFIAIPADSTAHARMSCPVTSDVTLTTAQTHMHKWGLGGTADLEDGKGALVEHLYTSKTWADPPVTEWSAPPMALKAGQQIDYECNYQNDGTTTIIQGLSALTNEMCVFVGAYYPRDQKFETCGTSGAFSDQGSAATFIGTGTATCSATLGCLQSAEQANTSEPFYSCMVDSCPGAAKPLTSFIDCALTLPQGGSVTTACANQLSSCIAASCSE
jgi:hypothetical protein